MDESAAIVIPSATWAEREGTFVNCDGLAQPFERALVPLDGIKSDGQFFYELAGELGLFRAAKTRKLMAAELPNLAQLHEPPELPEHAH